MLLPLVPALPLLGFLILFISGGRMPKRAVEAVGVGSVGIAAILALIVAAGFLQGPQTPLVVAWPWLTLAGFTPQFGVRLDSLSLVMMLVVTFVGFLIHLYSAEYMEADEGYNRFFASMNLFVAAMLVLVLADNLLFLYVGWEGVGLCSYLLIGFWYPNPANGLAARKAFIVTRVGDALMTVGLLLIYTRLGSLDIQTAMGRAAQQWPQGSVAAVAAAALLLGGAVGKSAQLPLQTWLPDAMAGPTPVSALIHAATMVTAGVYLIARTHVLYDLAPPVKEAVAVIGTATLLLASFSALNQRDLKRILAYSTISQIGYMFLALGVGAWAAAIFHLMTHAFFKALLFLSAGVVIHRMDEEQDIFRLGGLRRQMPLAFWTFLIGSASLAALPLVTAGFYSKDLIVAAAWQDSPWLGAAALLGAFLTAVYIFRAVFIVFGGPPRHEPHGPTGRRVAVPLLLLSVLAVTGGFVQPPSALGGAPLFTDFLGKTLPSAPATAEAADGVTLASGLIALAGIGVAYLIAGRHWFAGALQIPPARLLERWWAAGWGFDFVYDRLLVRPFLRLLWWNRRDFIDGVYTALAGLIRLAWRLLSISENGRLRWYAAGIAAGSIVALALSVFA